MTAIHSMPILDPASRGFPMNTLAFEQVKTRPIAGTSALRHTLEVCGPLPHAALFVGLANDGLPVLLNLHEQFPSPVLVAADPGGGKTRLLKTIARAIEVTQDADHVRYATITTSPSEWNDFGRSPHCEGILSFHHALTTGYMASLVGWAQSSRASQSRHLVVLVDDLHALAGDGDLRDSRGWLLNAGSAQGIRPIVSCSTADISMPASWLKPFTSRLFGCIRNGDAPRLLAGASDGMFSRLQPGSEFATREGSNWLQFWLPELD
jgi:hypothetical protein